MDEPSNENTISLKLTKNEAIVLFEFLGRFNEIENHNLFIDQAEERILWDLEAILEKLLPEPFLSSYPEIVKEARDNVRDNLIE